MKAHRFWVGVDTGGTFTDFVVINEAGERKTHKILSTPENPAEAVLQGLRELLPSGVSLDFTYGSTVATNALLERKGARTALISNQGFEDILWLARQTRPHLYRLRVESRPPLVSSEHSLGVLGRLGPDGEEIRPLSEEELRLLPERLQKMQVESVAICLLHSYANPSHESRVARSIASLKIPISLSSEILAEYREYERASTTVVNAYVAPKMSGHLEYLANNLAQSGSFRVMQSNGGAVHVETAAKEPVRTVLSGPAGGVVGAFAAARRIGFQKIITFDMGGTSTDVALCDEKMQTSSEGSVADIPVRVPLIDVHTVGAGGGSIVYIDPGGALKVGPKSAGAVPGPASYGQNGPATVTDANLVLGRIDPSFPLGGTLTLDSARAYQALSTIADSLQCSTEEAAEGVIRIANTAMEKAIRVISLERGFDPREFALLSFGGSGGLHACALAEALSIPKIIIPPDGGVLSAYGMVEADVVRDFSQTSLALAKTLSHEALEKAFLPLLEEAKREVQNEGFLENAITLECSVDLRYEGQSFELNVPYTPDLFTAFHKIYQTRYGYALLERNVEIVTLRVRGVGKHFRPVHLPKRVAKIEKAKGTFREVFYQGKTHTASVYLRENLQPGMTFCGPALVVEPIATTWISPGWTVLLATTGALILTAGLLKQEK